MSNSIPIPVRGTRATVSTPEPFSDVERQAAAFAHNRGAAAPTQAASPAPAPMPEPAAVPRPRQIPAAFAGIDFTIGAVVSDTGDTFPIDPDDMPKLLDFAFRVVMTALQDDVAALRERLGIPDPNAEGGNPNEPGGTEVPEVPANETSGEVQGG